MTIPPQLSEVLVSTPDTLHGAIRFNGTRVFAQSLFDYVMQGSSLEEFLIDFPDVSKDQAEAVLRWENERIRRDFGYELTA